MTGPRTDRSLGDLFGELSAQSTRLIRDEIRLAVVEIKRSIADVARESAMVGAGGAIAYAGAIVLLFGIGLLISDLINKPGWVGLVVVGAIVLIVGGVLAYRSLAALRAARVVPERTMETLRADADWAKEQTR